MRYAYSTPAIRAAEERAMAEVGDGALMQRAAAGLAAVCGDRLQRRRGRVTGARVLVVTGPGNNGGDGLYAASRLARRGAQVFAWLVTEQVHGAAWRAFERVGGRRLDTEQTLRRIAAGDFDQVIDAGFGIGGRAGLTGDLARIADATRGGPADVVAVDLPSGLDADSARAGETCFPADATVTFGARKPCLLSEPARSLAGAVTLVDIGLPLDPGEAELAQWELPELAAAWPYPGPTSDKYARGVVGIDAGSAHYPGAGLLAVGGAVHAGPGMVRFLGDERAGSIVVQRFPNVVTAAGRCQAYLLGPGWGDRDDARTTIESVLATGLPVVLDADALRHLPQRRLEHALLTPHAGELARLLEVDRDRVEADPRWAVRTAAERTGVTVLLKGATQYVARPGEKLVHTAIPGPAWTAQAGSGDTLAGVCATLLAAGLAPRDAALAGASLQAYTAAQHPGPWPPQELAERFPAVIASLSKERP
ncbi:NAD(P)H-hydrate epimerase [Enemella evansiae]|uniref:Bifunctional NAD(P)H-hydrate repair enzyme n=1 Tax=Enemella evansiae TaxID=2016499 RepID=A0A255GBZ6_9ACTN|nr:NAD(P)H-hydrate epimerase [Enemella evansiae]OYO10065.1 NAD(P)H-hydrate epimerase [Enemella evansiae]OYO13410.1 NAD(P)H-hydrate epimerase [Enemella evansiae]